MISDIRILFQVFFKFICGSIWSQLLIPIPAVEERPHVWNPPDVYIEIPFSF